MHHSGSGRLAIPYPVKDSHLLFFASLSWRSRLRVKSGAIAVSTRLFPFRNAPKADAQSEHWHLSRWAAIRSACITRSRAGASLKERARYWGLLRTATEGSASRGVRDNHARAATHAAPPWATYGFQSRRSGDPAGDEIRSGYDYMTLMPTKPPNVEVVRLRGGPTQVAASSRAPVQGPPSKGCAHARHSDGGLPRRELL